MSNTTADLVEKLNTATIWINQIFPVLQIVFGTFGNLFNLIIFSRRTLRTNPCSTYFLAGSVNNCFVIYIALLTRYLASTWNLDPSATNNIFCKLRNCFIYAPLTLALWFMVLASIDRFFSSSYIARFRKMSSLSIARKSIVITTVLIFLSYLHVPVYFRTAARGHVIRCVLLSYEYILFLSFFAPIISCILPIGLMSIFGILTILNVRNMHNRIIPQGNNKHLRSNDRQLIVMLLFQVLVTTLLSIPYFALAIYNAVAIIILQYKLSTSGQAIYNFAFNLFRLLYYTNPVIGFYIYTLTGPQFRIEIKRCTQHGLKSALLLINPTQRLPLRAQQPSLGQNQTRTNIQLITVRSKENATRLFKNQRLANMPSAV